MAKHPALVAFAAALPDLLALGPPDLDPDSPASVADDATLAEVERRAAAVVAAIDELSETECLEAGALMKAMLEKMKTRGKVIKDKFAHFRTFVHLPRPLPRA